ncbi:hypothetical protein [Duganella callida]|uniref:Uncharacterized protein n=1 Tax=Duganella callida TaxID=2561932 RepID=A0A4Y9S704_9BURK|nr:hypothetical protein [Duganella callida]TFW17252.1 hypothetical protein E4L98_21005 [Duganella callida]
MDITEEQIKAALEGGGNAWTEFFVLNSLIIARRDKNGTLFAKLIEDDVLSKAVKDFLITQGMVQNHSPNQTIQRTPDGAADR